MARSTIIFGKNFTLTTMIWHFLQKNARSIHSTGYFPYEASLLMPFSPKYLFAQQL